MNTKSSNEMQKKNASNLPITFQSECNPFAINTGLCYCGKLPTIKPMKITLVSDVDR